MVPPRRPDHASLAATLASLGAMAAERRAGADAMRAFRRAHDIAQTALGPAHRNTRALADCRMVFEDYVERFNAVVEARRVVEEDEGRRLGLVDRRGRKRPQGQTLLANRKAYKKLVKALPEWPLFPEVPGAIPTLGLGAFDAALVSDGCA